MSVPAPPDPAQLERRREYLAAGFFEEPAASPLRRWCRAVRRRWENQPTPRYDGGPLYPAGPKNGTGAANRIVSPSYSFTWSFQRPELERQLREAETEEARTALEALDRAMTAEVERLYVPPPNGHSVGGWGYTHSIPNYGRVVREGFNAHARRVRHALEAADGNGDREHVEFCRGMLEVLAGIRSWHRRLRAELERAEPATPEAAQNRTRLLDALTQVPFRPARTFFEALVAYNFVYYLDDCDNPGRIDQELAPLLEQDLGRGTLDLDAAARWVAAFADNVTVNWGWSAAIGGTGPDGRPAYNRMTELCLDAARGRPRPSWELRVRPDMPDRLWELALDALATGSGNPALYNEPAFLQSLLEADLGLDERDAAAWNGGGCTETMIHGCSNVGSLDAGINLPRILERTLHEHLEQVDDFEGVLEAVKRGFERDIRQVTGAVSEIQRRRAETCPQPMRSLLIDDCIDRARDFNAGGARCNWSVVNVAGLTDVADALAALREVVFERREVSPRRLLETLHRNFEDDEALRRRLERCPRFGNDDPAVDSLAADLATTVYAAFRSETPWRGGRFLPSCIMFETYARAGAAVGALPDGRRAGEPLADSIGPVAGRDRHGPTAMLRSVTRLPLHLATGTPVLNLRLARHLFSTPAGRARVRELIEAYFNMGGMQVQITATDRQTLLDALEHPERHEDLIVRIGGYATYFNRLPPELKQTVIDRTEYVV